MPARTIVLAGFRCLNNALQGAWRLWYINSGNHVDITVCRRVGKPTLYVLHRDFCMCDSADIHLKQSGGLVI